MKLNRKGFTLVELLVTIVIIGLVVGFSTYGIISLINNSEDKTITLSVDNLKEAARIYSAEAGSDSWKKTEYDYDAFCVTISELMNKGLLDQNAEIEGQRDRKDFIIVKRNKITLAIENEEIVSENINEEYNRVCTGQNVENEDYERPVIGTSVSYTDRIEIKFTPGSATYNGISSEISYKCLYGESSSNVNREGVIEGNTCVLDGLKNNKSYYALIYMNTSKGSSILANGSREYSTKDFADTTFVQNNNTLIVQYNNSNIDGSGYYYFKSDIDSRSLSKIEMCTMKNNVFSCTDSTNDVKSGVWYRTINSNVKLVYSAYDDTFDVNTKICDKSNNCHDNKETLDMHIVKFYRNGASNVDGDTSEYAERYCLTIDGSSCSITAPGITPQTGYSVVGWNTSSSATSSSWNVGTTKNINSNMNYYAITKVNTVTIKYNVNGGYIATKSNGNGTRTWSSNSSGIVLLNGSPDTSIISYGENLTSSGLDNYNNEDWLNIKRTGYTAVSGAEWKCLSGCSVSGKTYDHSVNYSASDFCDVSSSDCEVTLGVNWIDNAGPTFGNVEVKNITFSGYDICVYDVEDPSGINRVQFPTWTGSASSSNDQGDIQSNWEYNSVASGTDEGGGTWCYRVNVSDHNNESGNYNTHIYMYDNLGNRSNDGKNDIKVPCMLTFNPNGGVLSSPGKNLYSSLNPSNYVPVTYNSTNYWEMAGDIPTRSGYTFNGWYTATSGGTQVYGSDGKAVGDGAYFNSSKKWVYTKSGTVTLYAQWTANAYTITYNLDGGSVSTANPTSYTIETDTFTLNNPTKTGYTFEGWTGSNGTTKQTSVTISKGSTGDKSYTANWKSTGCDAEYRYTYSSSKITVYHVGTCNNTTSCRFDSVNGTSTSGTLTSSFYTKSALKNNLDTSTKYFNTSTVNCYKKPDTSSGSTPLSWCNTQKQCGNNTKDPNCIAVWETTTSGWYYSSSLCCYIKSSNLITSASTNNKNICAKS